jgi:Rho-type GTPase-activating protein 1/2
VSDAFEPSPRTVASTVTSRVKPLPSLLSFSSSQSISVTVAPPPESGYIHSEFGQYPPKADTYLGHDAVKQSTLPLPHASIGIDDGRRRSYDDGVRPLNILFGRKGESTQQLPEVPLTAPAVSEGLTAATSRRDKRNSINPGLSLSDFNTIASDPTLSPTRSSSRLSREPSTPPTPVASPFREQSNPQSPSSRPTSHSDSRLSHSGLQSSSSLPYAEVERQEPPRSSTLTMHLDEQDQTIVVRPSPPSAVKLDSVPPPKPRLRMRPFDGPSSPDVDGSKGQSSSSANLELKEVDFLRSRRSSGHQRQRGSRSDSGRLSDLSLSNSRSISPAHRADVPQNIESETETEAESDNGAQRSQIRELEPPAPVPPPKEDKDTFIETRSDADLDMSITTQLDNGSDDTESSPVEHTSHSTFIAPALPPIRFSMNTADFSELFNSVGGLPSIKSMDHLAKLSEEELHGNYTPPSTTTFETNLTPTSNTTVIPVVKNGSHGDNEAAEKRSSSCDDRSIDWYVSS